MDLDNYKSVGAKVRISSALVADSVRSNDVFDRLLKKEMTEAMLDITVGPRYGPPAPRVHYVVDICDCCGQEIRDDWDD